MGFNVNNKESLNMERAFPWKKVNETAHKFTLAFGRKFNKVINFPTYNYREYFINLCDRVGANRPRIQKSIGTLGGGK